MVDQAAIYIYELLICLLGLLYLIEKWHGKIFYTERKKICETKLTKKIYEIHLTWYIIITTAQSSIIHDFIAIWVINGKEMADALELQVNL